MLLTNRENDNHITHRIKYLFFYSSCMHQNCNVAFNTTIQFFSNKIKNCNELLIWCKHTIFNIEVLFHGFEPLWVTKFLILWPFFHNYNQLIRFLNTKSKIFQTCDDLCHIEDLLILICKPMMPIAWHVKYSRFENHYSCSTHKLNGLKYKHYNLLEKWQFVFEESHVNFSIETKDPKTPNSSKTFLMGECKL